MSDGSVQTGAGGNRGEIKAWAVWSEGDEVKGQAEEGREETNEAWREREREWKRDNGDKR